MCGVTEDTDDGRRRSSISEPDVPGTRLRSFASVSVDWIAMATRRDVVQDPL